MLLTDKQGLITLAGVTRCGDKWKVKITHEGKEHFLGLFDDEMEAALAWDAKAKELRGEFAYLNFPDSPPPGSKPGSGRGQA